MKTYGEIIRRRRRELNMSQETLGNLVGIQKSGIAKHEKGRIVALPPEMAVKFAQALDLSEHLLLDSLATTLRRLGYEPVSAEDGSVALLDGEGKELLRYPEDLWDKLAADNDHRRVLADLRRAVPEALQDDSLRTALHALIDALPEEKLQLLEAYLVGLRDK